MPGTWANCCVKLTSARAETTFELFKVEVVAYENAPVQNPSTFFDSVLFGASLSFPSGLPALAAVKVAPVLAAPDAASASH